MKSLDKQKRYVLKLANMLETVLAFIILMTVVLGIIDTLRRIYNTYIIHFSTPLNYQELNSLFATILLLVIGVELAVMLSLHIQRALIDLLLFGIARKMLLVPKSDGMVEILLGVIAIGFLFVIKKHLVRDSKDIELDSTHNNG